MLRNFSLGSISFDGITSGVRNWKDNNHRFITILPLGDSLYIRYREEFLMSSMTFEFFGKQGAVSFYPSSDEVVVVYESKKGHKTILDIEKDTGLKVISLTKERMKHPTKNKDGILVTKLLTGDPSKTYEKALQYLSGLTDIEYAPAVVDSEGNTRYFAPRTFLMQFDRPTGMSLDNFEQMVSNNIQT